MGIPLFRNPPRSSTAPRVLCPAFLVSRHPVHAHAGGAGGTLGM